MTTELPDVPQEDVPHEQQQQEPSVWARITGTAGGNWRDMILLPLLALATALIVGGLILVVTDLDLWEVLRDEGFVTWVRESVALVWSVYTALFSGAFGSPRAISETLLATSPLIFTGLAVAVGFRAGLFNIGGEGQMLMGGLAAVTIGFWWDFLPFPLHMLAAVVAAMVAGGIWAGIAGLLKARTGAHEVITTIMLNAVAGFLVTWLLKTDFIRVPDRNDPVSKTIAESAELPRLLTWLDPQLRVHLGIVVALLTAWFVWWLLFRSTIGFQFRAVGFNPDASRYAGMKVSFLVVAVMAVSGALAGMGGADVTLGVLGRATPGFAAGVGFTGIVVALLGRSHPGGVVLAALLFGALSAGGREMQVQTQISVELVSVIQALVLLFIAAPALIRGLYRLKPSKDGEEIVQLTSGWGA